VPPHEVPPPPPPPPAGRATSVWHPPTLTTPEEATPQVATQTASVLAAAAPMAKAAAPGGTPMISTLVEDPHIEPSPEPTLPQCLDALKVRSGAPRLGPPPSFQAPAPPPGGALSWPEAQRALHLGALGAWNTGGTGGTGELGLGAQAMVHMMAMAEQARLAENYPSFPLVCGVELPEGSGAERRSPQDPSAPDPGWLQREDDLGEDDSPLEAMGKAMVEDLVGEWDLEPEAHAPLSAGGVSSLAHPLLEDLSDAFNKVAAASGLLSKVLDSGLRRTAPTFVPGEMWTGQGRSSFVD